MSDRRSFIKKTSIGALGAIITPKIASSKIQKQNLYSQKGLPIIISTWQHGLAANAEAYKLINKGFHAIDAVEAAVCVAEADPECTSVGYGGWPDRDGNVTLDACIMDHSYQCDP